MSGDEKENEFRRMIKLNVTLLKLSGVIPCGKGFAGRNAFASFAFACLTLYSVSYTHELLTNTTDLTTVLEFFAISIPIVGGQARFTILLWFRGKCRRMLETCEFFWSILKSQEKDLVRSYVMKTRRITCWYSASVVSTILFYAVFALLGSFMARESQNFQLETKNHSDVGPSGDEASLQAIRQLPYVFFLKVTSTPWYEIVYATQIITMFNVGFICIGVDMAGPLFILITCGHFEAVRSRIENLHTASSSTISAPTIRMHTSNVQLKNLRLCVIHHRMLLEFCKNIEHLMNVIFLTQLIGSTYSISLVGFKLVEDNPDKYKYITQLSIGVIQLLLCNWPADVLLAKSEAIGRAAYLVPWYQYPGHLQKPTSMLMIRGQRPVRLTAGKFVALSLQTFASMISTAASFFTVVRSVN
ncbi:odorant receptor 10 [Xylocopa sonorina]|uniref:odorant receptor 10 n=1 Tax=Xylocopa sonorina TaxID=1818115 RepID=UPI00403A7D50